MTPSTNIRTHFRACNLCEAICGLEITVNDQHEILTIKGDEKDFVLVIDRNFQTTDGFAKVTSTKMSTDIC